MFEKVQKSKINLLRNQKTIQIIQKSDKIQHFSKYFQKNIGEFI
jgi:hypothetical protein